MSLHVEWSEAIHQHPEVMGPGEFTDAYDNSSELPCLILGGDTYFIIEGSIKDLRKLALDISSAIDQYEEGGL